MTARFSPIARALAAGAGRPAAGAGEPGAGAGEPGAGTRATGAGADGAAADVYKRQAQTGAQAWQDRRLLLAANPGRLARPAGVTVVS